MDFLQNTLFSCYCSETIIGAELQSHFAVCRNRDFSELYRAAEALRVYFDKLEHLFFFEQELEHELGRLRLLHQQKVDELEKLRHPKPKVRIVPRTSNCQLCDSRSASARPCGHLLCQSHPEVCPLCCCLCGDKESAEKISLHCGHTVCLSHPKEQMEKFERTGTLQCMECIAELSHPELQKVFGGQEFDRVMMKLAVPEGWLIVTCVKCGVSAPLEPAEVDYSVRDSKGRVYSREAAECYAHFRFKCFQCNSAQCGSCLCFPYHEGLTCEQNKGVKCRYCEELPCVAHDSCQSEECQKQLALSCKKTLPCGHRCFGIEGESICPGCLEDSCSHGQAGGSEFCVICGTDKNRNKPIVLLECSHLLHFSCLKEVLRNRWTTSRITFTFARCPLCREFAWPVDNPELREEMRKIADLYENIRDRGMAKLDSEPEEQKRVNNPADKQYFRQPEKYIMDRFCFYECFKCRQVYFGGKKECEAGENRAQNPEEFLCPNCTVSNSFNASGTHRSCSLHGIDFIEYKCRYCCSVAIYYCWGTTHFCEACHKRHNSGEYMTDKKEFQLPKCPGRLSCPLRVDHPPNGREFVLGCSLCRQK